MGYTKTNIDPFPVGELDSLGFCISPREEDTEYRVQIGDLDLTSAAATAGQVDLTKGRASGIDIWWDDAQYFESARGLVSVSVESRILDEPESWTRRAILPVNAIPTKLGEMRYGAMFDQLRLIAADLVFDLVSKARRSISYGGRPAEKVSHRSSQLELRVIERLWNTLAQVLHDIARDPVKHLRRTKRLVSTWDVDDLSVDAVCTLAGIGTDLRHPHIPKPVQVSKERLEESADTLEHRSILGFLQILAARVHDCALSAQAQADHLNSTKELRNVRIEPGPTLFETFDRPRIERLRSAILMADRLLACFRQAADLDFLRGLTPEYRIPQTPTFKHVTAYNQFRTSALGYLESSLAILDDGFVERIKSTSRMYEQWTFFQIAAAFQRAGLRCESIGDFLQRLGRQRFTLDLDERARLVFRSASGRQVIVRYEPFILPQSLATRDGDTVYRGKTGTAPWRPDILIEFVSPRVSKTQYLDIEYAVVVDAKYSKAIHDHHWSRTEKYAGIRATASDRQVVRQIWLAYPSTEDGISCRDPAVTWTADGPDRPRDETIHGTLGLVPPTRADSSEVHEEFSTPAAVVQNFISGLLSYVHGPSDGHLTDRG